MVTRVTRHSLCIASTNQIAVPWGRPGDDAATFGLDCAQGSLFEMSRPVVGSTMDIRFFFLTPARVGTRCVSKPVDDGCSQRAGREEYLLVIGRSGWPRAIAGRQSFGLPNTISIKLPRYGLRRLWYPTGFSRCFQPGMQVDAGTSPFVFQRLPLSFDASPKRSASEPPRATFGGLFGNARAPMQSPTSTAEKNGSGDRAPLSDARTGRCAMRLRISRGDRDRPFFSAIGGQTRHRPGEDALSLHRFQRLWSVLCGPYSAGASRHFKPLRSMKKIPLDTR